MNANDSRASAKVGIVGLAASFGAGFLLASIAALGIDVYLLDHFERAWGKAWSFQVSVWLALVSSLLSAVIFAAAQGIVALPEQARLIHRARRAFLVGAVIAVALTLEAHLSARLFGFASRLSHASDLGIYIGLCLAAGVLAKPAKREPVIPNGAA